MARDRKRAKQRRDRRGRAGGRGATPTDRAQDRASSTPTGQPGDGRSSASELPGSLEHASAQADEFDAALVRGAEGVVAEPAAGPEDGLAAGGVPAPAPEPAAEAEDEVVDQAGDELAVAETIDERGRRGDAAQPAVARDRAAAHGRGGGRAIAFLPASWAELQRVQWPDRRQTTQATAVVLGFVVVAGAYLGLADYVAKEIVEFVL